MKRKTASALISLLLLVCVIFSFSSCYLLDGGVLSSLGGGGDTTINVEGGDSYNVSITGGASNEIMAASKALLSSVSIICQFEKYAMSGSHGQGTKETYYSAGSGVIYQLDKNNGNAYIITNYHVVYDVNSNTANHISNKINVYLYGQEFANYAIEAKYIGGSMNYDLAVLEVKNSQVIMESAAAAVSVADSNKVSVLETAIAIGNPEGEGISATVGYINVDSEEISMTGSDNQTQITLRVMRTDAAVNSGNSGGGLFNAKGELIGIVNAKMSDTTIDNIGYAIPSNIAAAIANNIIYYCKDTNVECVRRALLGITVSASESRAKYDTESGKIYKHETIVVNSVEQGSAVSGKLFADDIINSVTIDGVKYEVSRMFHIVDSMLNAKVGSSVVISVTRGGETIDVPVQVTAAMIVDYK